MTAVRTAPSFVIDCATQPVVVRLVTITRSVSVHRYSCEPSASTSLIFVFDEAGLTDYRGTYEEYLAERQPRRSARSRGEARG